MKTIIIIQARMGSSRLPGKILKPLGRVDSLTYVTERCRKIHGVDEVIVATSNLPQDDEVEAWCIEHNIAYYRGSEDDVLARYMQCAHRYNPDYIMRVTSDCPFIDYEIASEMVALMKEHQVDIIDLASDLPRGLAVEIIAYKALQYIYEHSREQRHREHVTYYAYEYKEQFTRVDYIAPTNRHYSELRITLDTAEDYALLSNVADYFSAIDVSSSDVIQYLLAHPEVVQLNAHIEQKPVT
ncbi:glycosyltransferase family protein [Paenibacillus endoradicis]|uniref:glycosyltransferase family protein n=1 Tax=Paenibacillus endoradicis TaxID=2972487 RepID=UPI002158DC31|nr:glycosyltransferase family protein [Paenibacillus endoradicis]MCR8660530.1 glycosyltransferase family protein [Paenibacillus endoradicis]